MHDRLAKLFLASPPSDTAWTGPPPEWQHPVIKRRDGQPVKIARPLFWYNPPWHQLPTDRANSLAMAVGQLGVTVSALRSDLSAANALSGFHDEPMNERKGRSVSPRSRLPVSFRIVPNVMVWPIVILMGPRSSMSV